MFSMVLTLSGMITEVRVVEPRNTSCLMTVTGFPPNVEGIVIAPPAPVYPVMVATPFFTVYV